MIGIRQVGLITLGSTAIGGGGLSIYYLTKDNSIRNKLLSEEVELISLDQEYWVVFKENKNNPDFINLIKGEDQSASNWEMRKGGNALKNWCNNILKLSSNNLLLEKARKYCSKPPMTIEAKMKKLSKKWVIEWNKKLEELSKPSIDTELTAELKKINEKVTSLDIPDKQTVFKALEDWCKGNKNEKLIDQKAEEIWNKLEKRCFA